MTCNQLITLLEIYRTGKVDRIHCGTTADDLSNLSTRKLIRWEEEGWSITEKGNTKIESILEILS